MEEQHKIELIKLSVEKSKQALDSAQALLDGNHLEAALNRNYYAIFYMVLALGYQHDFITSKHSQLMGWFNKKFIHEDKICDETLFTIYLRAFERRQKSDYDITYKPQKESIGKLLMDSEHFIKTIEKVIDGK